MLALPDLSGLRCLGDDPRCSLTNQCRFFFLASRVFCSLLLGFCLIVILFACLIIVYPLTITPSIPPHPSCRTLPPFHQLTRPCRSRHDLLNYSRIFLISSCTIDDPVRTVNNHVVLNLSLRPPASIHFCIDYLHSRVYRITLTISYSTNKRYGHSHPSEPMERDFVVFQRFKFLLRFPIGRQD